MIAKLEIPMPNPDNVQVQPLKQGARGKPFLECLEEPPSTKSPPPSLLAQSVHAPAWAGPTTLELHFRHGDGTATVMTSHWGLVANGHLSQAWASTPNATSDSGSQVAPSAASKVDCASVGVTFPDGVKAPPSEMKGGLMKTTAVLPNASMRPDAADETLAPEMRRIRQAAEVAPWMPRLLRWLEGGQAGEVVWVRDYRLDERDAVELVAAVRKFADEHRISLERIVLNARVLWHANGLT